MQLESDAGDFKLPFKNTAFADKLKENNSLVELYVPIVIILPLTSYHRVPQDK